MPSGTARIASLREVARDHRRRRRSRASTSMASTSSSRPPSVRADLEHRLRDVDLVRVQLAREALEVAQRLEAGDLEPARAHGAHAGRDAARMPDDVAAPRSSPARSRRSRTAASLVSSDPASDAVVHAEVVEDHRAPAPRARSARARTSRRRASGLVSAPRSLACTLLGVEELDAALLAGSRPPPSTSGVPRPIALQVLVHRVEPRRVLGLDQLQEEGAGTGFRAAGPRAGCRSARSSRQRREAEELRVELGPVRGAVGADVLDDAEEVHAGERRRMRVDGRDRAEVDVVDRELVVAVDEVDAGSRRRRGSPGC